MFRFDDGSWNTEELAKALLVVLFALIGFSVFGYYHGWRQTLTGVLWLVGGLAICIILPLLCGFIHLKLTQMLEVLLNKRK